MKKLFITLLAISTLALTGCGNHDIGWGSYDFHYVHVQMYGMTTPIHLHVKSWKGDTGGIELKVTFDNQETSILLGDGTYMMYDTETCPVCGKVNYK